MNIRIPALLLLLLSASVSAGVAAQDRYGSRRTQWAQLTVHERVMIRIPRRARLAPPPRGRALGLPREQPIIWSERRAPRCIPMDRLTGDAAVRGGDVDLLLVNGRRLRAKLSRDCPALDFYSGFYLKPNPDGLICGGRDVLRARSGGACPIAGFRRLEAAR